MGWTGGKFEAAAGVTISARTIRDMFPDIVGPSNAWVQKASMPTARFAPTASVVDGKIYVIGGYSNDALKTNEMYDPETDTWTTKANMPTARFGLGSAVVDRKIYCIGGDDGSVFRTNEMYDPDTDTWTTKASMPTERNGFAIGVVGDGIYCIGGFDRWGPVYHPQNNEKYDPFTNTWVSKMNIPVACGPEPGYGVVGNKIYVLCGSQTDKVQIYDATLNTWTFGTSAPTKQYYCASGVIKNKIHLVGGNNPEYNDRLHQVYDTSNDVWTTKAYYPLGLGVFHAAGAVVDDKLYCIGGRNGSSPTLATNYMYYPEIDPILIATIRAGNKIINNTPNTLRFITDGGDEISIESYTTYVADTSGSLYAYPDFEFDQGFIGIL